MVKKSKEYIPSGKIFSLILIVFFLFVSKEVAYSQSIRIIYPNTDVVLRIGEYKRVIWNCSGFSSGVKAKLYLIQSGKGRIGTIMETALVNRSVAFNWKVGEYRGGMAAPGSGYKVCLETLDGQYRDCSDRHFKLAPPYSKVETKPPIVKWKLPDFKIRDVRHNYRHKKVVVYFDGGLGKYQGPLDFDVKISLSRPSTYYIINRRVTVHDNRVEVFSLNLVWPPAHLREVTFLYVLVAVNPDRAIAESSYNNNHYDGRIFENSTDFKLVDSCYDDSRRYPSIYWLKDHRHCDGVTIAWTEETVKNAIQRGEFRYYDPYDPNTNTLLGTAKVWIGNFSRDEGTAHVTFKFVSYNGVRRVERHIPLMPGEKKLVEAGIMLNLQRENSIEAWVDSRSSVERARINIRFHGLPYDLD